MPKVVIVLPAYRAEGTLERTVAEIPPGVSDTLILVDDASGDATAEVAEGLGIHVVRHDDNRGYGGNQKTCYTEALRAGADIVVLLHPDYQYDPKAVPLLIAPILAGDADMTFGSRFAGMGNPLAGGMPRYRYAGNRITTTIENLLLGTRFTDMHSGMRAYTRRCLLSLPFMNYSDDFVFDAQFLVDAVTLGQRVVEVPIPTRYTKESSSISIARSLRYITQSLAYASKRARERGRRGRRSPVRMGPRARGRVHASHGAVEHLCVLCGGHEQTLVYPANASGDIPTSEFACTTGALGRHDDIVQCRTCGLMSARAPLAAEEIVDRYEDVVDEEYLDEEPARRELFEWIVDAAAGHPVEGRRLLEIGANVGLFLDVARTRGWEARGIEPSQWAVKTGRERFDVDLRQGTVETLDAEPGSADIAVMLDVLEHVSDPVAALRTLRPVLQDEGALVLSTVNLSGLHARARGEHWPWFIRSHLFYFSPETLRATLAAAGFRMTEWRIVPRSFHLSYLAARAGSSHPRLGRLADGVARVADVRLPVGWLGDIALVVARPE